VRDSTSQSLSGSLPFLDPIVDSNAAVKGFLQGFLPTLVLIVFMALLPAILRGKFDHASVYLLTDDDESVD